MPDYAKAARIIVALAPAVIEAARQYNESRSRAQQAPGDAGPADGAPTADDGPARPAPPPPPNPARRPTDDVIDRIRFR